MNVLLTAGGSHTRVDDARVLATPSLPRGSAKLVHAFWARGHDLTLLSSSPESLTELPPNRTDRIALTGFQSADDLFALLPGCLNIVRPDVFVHAAAVGEYRAAGVFAPGPGATVRPPDPLGTDAEQWVRLVRTRPLAEHVRPAWGFHGVFAVVRLEPDVPGLDLNARAESLCRTWEADAVALSTPQLANHWWHLGPIRGRFDRTPKRELAERLVVLVEELHRARAGRGEHPDRGDG